MRKMLTIGVLIMAATLIGWSKTPPVRAASPFSGKILLAVEGHGEAWYINPTDQKRYFLGRPADAFQVMRALAIGISNADFALLENNQLATSKAQKLLGRILIKPQDNGQAYYYEPNNKKLHYLGRPADAFKIMKETAVGAANQHLDPIPTGQIQSKPAVKPTTATSTSTTSPTAKVWRWRLGGRDYQIQLELTAKNYDYYRNQSKVFSYSGNLPANWQDQYYNQFLKGTEQTLVINQIVSQLQQQAQSNQLTADQTAELAAAFIQSIPYDQERSRLIEDKTNQATPNYPYETLYLNKGVCADKSLLAWLIFHQLGYGTVLMSYPEANHMALGVSCPKDAANYSPAYCYLETTQFYHIGLVPNSISGQAASTTAETLPTWLPSGNLARPQLHLASAGKNYTGLSSLKALLQQMTTQRAITDQLRVQIDTEKPIIEAQQAGLQQKSQELNNLKAAQKTTEYNQQVPIYNQMVQDYEQTRQGYNQKITAFNESIKQYNQLLAKIQPSQTTK